MIPRQSGDVILGGTFQPDDWCVDPDTFCFSNR
jgi:hypothetical protein